LAAGLRPDPLMELKRSPYMITLAAPKWGGTGKGREGSKRRRGKQRGEGEKRGEGKGKFKGRFASANQGGIDTPV